MDQTQQFSVDIPLFPVPHNLILGLIWSLQLMGFMIEFRMKKLDGRL